MRQLEEDRRLLGTEIIPSGDKTWPLPCNLKRMIWNAQKLFVQPKNEPSKLEVLAIKAGVDRLLKQLMVRDPRVFVTASVILVQRIDLFYYPHASIGGKVPSAFLQISAECLKPQFKLLWSAAVLIYQFMQVTIYKIL